MKSSMTVLIIFVIDLYQIRGQYNKSLTCSVPRPDLFGNGVRLLRNIAAFLGTNNAMLGMGVCNRTVFSIDKDQEIKLSWLPLGNCTYCCPINDPADYIGLYFVNKQTVKPVYIKPLYKLKYIKLSGFNKDLPTIIYIHGFSNGGNGFDGIHITEAYLSRDEDYNIILIDWKDLSAGPWYHQAVVNVEIAGKAIANVLEFYSKSKEIYLSKVHIIGSSLGAHLAGAIGKHLIHNNRTIKRITGLDPAFPLFHPKVLSRILSKSDANFVDVIHTNGGFAGYPTSLGHADFYINGGVFQPGCESNHYIVKIFCSHVYAFEIYAESVKNSSAFQAVSCGNVINNKFVDKIYMGFSANPNNSGDFYVNTGYNSQFLSRNRK